MDGMNQVKTILVAAFFLAGCGKKEKPEPAAPPQPLEPGVFLGENAKPLRDMEMDDVIVSVNGTAWTRREFDRLMNMHEAVFKLHRPTAPAVEVNATMRARSLAAVPDFVTRQLMLQEAARRGLTTTDEGRLVNLSSQRELEARQRKPMDEIYRAMGETGALFKQRLEEDALIQTLRLDAHGGRIRVADADIAAYYGRHRVYAERCAATNALVMARGERLMQWLLRDGEDFTALADSLSEFDEDGPGGGWGEFTPSEIDDPALRKAVLGLPVGGIAGPFDTDEGMVIVKLLARSGEGEESEDNLMPLTFTLARIGLRMYEKISPDDPPPERAEVQKALERQRMMDVQREWLPQLRAAARIEYPNGTNFWAKARGGGMAN